jgi:hypothetical protein
MTSRESFLYEGRQEKFIGQDRQEELTKLRAGRRNFNISTAADSANLLSATSDIWFTITAGGINKLRAGKRSLLDGAGRMSLLDEDRQV